MTLDLDALASSDEEVARMTRTQRDQRLDALILEADRIYLDAISAHVIKPGKTLVASVGLFSGGNDSTLLMHLFRDRLTHAAHANTGIGIERTRQFVRDLCESWRIPLLERSAPYERDTYRALVLDQGFPGPAHHFKMYQRLKERALEQVRRELIAGKTRTNRVIFLAGRRRQESQRRSTIPAHERKGSTIWVSPLVNWTKIDMNTYRLRHRDTLPRNEVSDLIHMSGECLCGSFAHAGEFEEIAAWFPEVTQYISDLEAEVLATGKHPAWRCRWGWGADKDTINKMRKDGMDDNEIAALFQRSVSGPLCTSCETKTNQAETVIL